MPEIDPDRWRAISLRLDEALDLSDEERAPWLAALHEQDPALADAVRDLLLEHQAVRQHHFLEQEFVLGPTAGIEFLPFGSAGRARAIRVASLMAPPTHHVTFFAVAPDESWLVWAQDDYRNSDIMMLGWR